MTLGKTIRLLVLIAIACAPLTAREQGDFTPRGALMHARIANAQAVLKKLGGGDDYLAPLERMWAAAPKRDAEEVQPLIDEVRAFVKHANAIEFALGDIMVREPYTQTITVFELSEGAPEQFSEAVRAWVKAEGGRKAVAEAKAIDFEVFRIRLYKGMLIATTGEGMLKFVEDVLAGKLEESISQVKRFKDWREHARGDLVAFADMKQWRNCVDRLGRDVDNDLRTVLEIGEWQKWDVLSIELDLPGQTDTGLVLRADLTLTEPLGSLASLSKPAGGFSLLDVLPAETLGVIAAQLGGDHERTYGDILRFMHDIEGRGREASLKRQIEMYERLAARSDEAAENAQDEESKKEYKKQAEEYRAQVKETQAELANLKPRAFEPDRNERRRRQLRASEAEQFSDEFEKFCKEAGFTKEEVFEVLGNEVAAGIVGLPDPSPEDNDPGVFEHLWFVVAKAKGDLKTLKDKFIAAVAKDKKRDSEDVAIGKKVDGGEIIRLGGDAVIFIGEGFAGFCANTDVAKRILSASAGKDRLSASRLPGGLPAGSKLAYADVGEMVARMLDGEAIRRAKWGDAPLKIRNARKMLKNGLRLCAFDTENPTRISLQIATGGEANLRNVAEAVADDLEFDRAWRHDRYELEALGDACDAWLSANRDALAKMGEGERRDTISAVNIESLLKDGRFVVRDGLRSCFDPKMADRFKEMLKTRGDKLGENASDLAEIGFDWYGLPWTEVKIRSGQDYDYGSLSDSWLVAASKHAVREGRICLLQTGLNFQTVWLSEDDYNAVRLANTSGGRLKTFKEKAEQPLWKLKVKLLRMRYELNNTAQLLRQALQQPDGSFKEFSFKGSEHDDAVAALFEKLKLDREKAWADPTAVSRMEIEVKDKGLKVRITLGGQWIELDQNGKMTTSWGDE